MIRRPPRSTQSRSSAASDVYKRQVFLQLRDGKTGKRFGQKFWADFNVQVKEQAKDLEYTENMLKLAQMYESTDPELIIKLLKENKNNAELVANLLISQAH
eukprot:TRINITY_DN2524_c0_g4_i3.p1 TRINITY_DN2524_c0_g4~~TRINITY_DN2524_c0_g4_i3.p1  ORF type:complete len:109 (-),score=40.07 TRINITY_DN2524_c0_g4_i3:113-415(-)